MKQYLTLLSKLLHAGNHKPSRGVVGKTGAEAATRSLFGEQLRFDLSEGFPLLTTKRVAWKSVVVELLWFLRGDTNLKFLHDHGVTIWDEWADEDGDLGPVYGAQWRRWGDDHGNPPIDQIAQLIDGLRKNPHGRRHIVSAWNVTDIPKMKLPPCHCFAQFYVADGKLSCQLMQRSADIFLGVPFNIASYALLTHMIAAQVKLEVGSLIVTFGDVHLYENHVDAAKEQLTRTPGELPALHLEPSPSIDDYTLNHIQLIGYVPQARIAADVVV